MDDAGDFALMVGLDGDDITPVALGDERFLQKAIFLKAILSVYYRNKGVTKMLEYPV